MRSYLGRGISLRMRCLFTVFLVHKPYITVIVVIVVLPVSSKLPLVTVNMRVKLSKGDSAKK